MKPETLQTALACLNKELMYWRAKRITYTVNPNDPRMLKEAEREIATFTSAIEDIQSALSTTPTEEAET